MEGKQEKGGGGEVLKQARNTWEAKVYLLNIMHPCFNIVAIIPTFIFVLSAGCTRRRWRRLGRTTSVCATRRRKGWWSARRRSSRSPPESARSPTRVTSSQGQCYYHFSRTAGEVLWKKVSTKYFFLFRLLGFIRKNKNVALKKKVKSLDFSLGSHLYELLGT